MLNFDVRSNVASLSLRLSEFQKEQLPFATVFALTKTAQDIEQAEYAAMRQYFDRPTPFTLNSLRVQPATKREPIATVAFKDGFGSVPAWRYLGPEIEGGPRSKKSHERALERAGILRSGEFVVPGKLLDLDAFGNVKGSQITRILSDVQANPDPQSNSTRKTRGKRRQRGGGVYFVVRGKGVPDGIYFRLGLRDIRPIMMFVRQPRYAKRLPFAATAEQTFNAKFNGWMTEGIRRFPTNVRIPRII